MLKDVPPLPHHIKTINDTVMGGSSHSRVQITNQKIHFSGEVSLANNGGFASMRGIWPWLNSPLVIDMKGIKIIFKGDGKRYQFRLFTADNNDGSAYVYHFDTKMNEPIVVNVPVSAFEASYRGRPIEKPGLQLKDVLEDGLLIGDQQEGRFSLVLESLSIIN